MFFATVVGWALASATSLLNRSMSNPSTEQTAIQAVIAYERKHGRTATRTAKGSGYDLTSAGPEGERHIEVKSTTRTHLTDRWLEPLEYERFLDDPAFYIYAVVDCAGTPRVVEFDRGTIASRYVGAITKHMLRFRRSDFASG